MQEIHLDSIFSRSTLKKRERDVVFKQFYLFNDFIYIPRNIIGSWISSQDMLEPIWFGSLRHITIFLCSDALTLVYILPKKLKIFSHKLIISLQKTFIKPRESFGLLLWWVDDLWNLKVLKWNKLMYTKSKWIEYFQILGEFDIPCSETAVYYFTTRCQCCTTWVCTLALLYID